MLRLVIYILVILFLSRLIAPFVRGARRALGGIFSGQPQRSGPRAKGPGPQGKAGDYSDLTPYEIEDADFEEIRKDKDGAS